MGMGMGWGGGGVGGGGRIHVTNSRMDHRFREFLWILISPWPPGKGRGGGWLLGWDYVEWHSSGSFFPGIICSQKKKSEFGEGLMGRKGGGGD